MLFGLEYEFQVQLDLEYALETGQIPSRFERFQTVYLDFMEGPLVDITDEGTNMEEADIELPVRNGAILLDPPYHNFRTLVLHKFPETVEFDAGNLEVKTSEPKESIEEAIESVEENLALGVDFLRKTLHGICDFAIFTPKTYKIFDASSTMTPSKHLNMSAQTSKEKIFLQHLEKTFDPPNIKWKRGIRLHINLPYRYDTVNFFEEGFPAEDWKENKVSLVGYSEYLCDKWKWHERIV